MAVTINVQASQTALAQSIAQGVAAFNAKMAGQNQLNLQINAQSFTQPLGRISGDLKQFQSALAASNARVLAFGASTAVIGGVAKSFKDLATSTVEVEKALVDINRVLALSSSGLQKFSSDLFGVAKATASSFQDASEAALEFSRQGLSTEQTLQRVADALTLVRLTGVSAKQAVEDLTAVTNAYSQASLDTTTILNKIVAVEQAFAVSAADLTSAVSRTGQAAQEAGVSFDQLNALVTSAQEKTARGGAVIGNALKTIFTRLQRTETLDQLENFNIAVRDIQGNVLPAVKILQNLASTYNTLADTTRSSLAEQVAGVYQVNILKSIIADLNDQQGDYNRALEIGTKATNEAQQANAALNVTLAALISQTGTNLQQLSNNIGKVTFEPVFKSLISPFNDAITYINDLLEGEGLGSQFAGGLLKGVKNILGGPALFGAVAIITKVIGNTFKDITTAVPTLLGITTQSQRRKDVEESILKILQGQSQASLALKGQAGNLTAQQQTLLNLARYQTAEYTNQLNLAKQLAATLVGKNVQVGAAGLQVGKITARGHIPTYGNGYVPGNARRAEIAGAISGGYKPGAVVPSPVGGVMNTAETVKYVPGFAQPFINPPEYSRAGVAHKSAAIRETGVNPYRAKGYIPNFGIGGFKAWLRGKPGGEGFLAQSDLSDINWYRQNPQLVAQLQTYLSQYQAETKDQYSPAILNNFLKQTERGYTGSAISAQTGQSTFTAEKQFKAVPETPSVKPQIKAASVVARFKSSKSFEAAYPDLLNIVNDPNISQEERDKAQNVLKQSFGKAYEDFALKELKKMGFGGAVTAESIGLYGSGYGQTAVDAVDFGTKTFFEFKGGEVENKNINEKFDRVRTDPGNFDVLTKKVWKNVLVSNEYNQGAKSGNKVIYINPVDQVNPQLYLKEGLGTATKSFGPQAIKDVRGEIIKEAKRVTQFNFAGGFIPNFAQSSIADILGYSRVAQSLVELKKKGYSDKIQLNDKLFIPEIKTESFDPATPKYNAAVEKRKKILSQLSEANANLGKVFENEIQNKYPYLKPTSSGNEIKFSNSSALDFISNGSELIEGKAGNYSKKAVEEKFLRFPFENYNNPQYNQFLQDFSPGIDNVSLYRNKILKLITAPQSIDKPFLYRESDAAKYEKNLKLFNSAKGFIPNFANQIAMPIWMHPDAGIFKDEDAADHNDLKEIFKGKIPRDSLRGYVQGNTVTLDAPLNFLYRNDKDIKQKIAKINALIKSKFGASTRLQSQTDPSGLHEALGLQLDDFFNESAWNKVKSLNLRNFVEFLQSAKHIRGKDPELDAGLEEILREKTLEQNQLMGKYPKGFDRYSGFIPNFAKKWVYDSDLFGGEYNEKFINLKKYILNNRDVVKDLLLAPSGAGKTTFAQQQGYTPITDFSKLSKGDRVLLLSASNLNQKGKISGYLREQIAAVNQTGGHKWFGDVPNETIKARRIKRFQEQGIERGIGTPLRDPGYERILKELGFEFIPLGGPSITGAGMSGGFNFGDASDFALWREGALSSDDPKLDALMQKPSPKSSNQTKGVPYDPEMPPWAEVDPTDFKGFIPNFASEKLKNALKQKTNLLPNGNAIYNKLLESDIPDSGLIRAALKFGINLSEFDVPPAGLNFRNISTADVPELDFKSVPGQIKMGYWDEKTRETKFRVIRANMLSQLISDLRKGGHKEVSILGANLPGIREQLTTLKIKDKPEYEVSGGYQYFPLSQGFIPNFLPTNILAAYKEYLARIKEGNFKFSGIFDGFQGKYVGSTGEVFVKKVLSRQLGAETLAHEMGHGVTSWLPELTGKLANIKFTEEEINLLRKMDPKNPLTLKNPSDTNRSNYAYLPDQLAAEIVVDPNRLQALASPEFDPIRKKLGLTPRQVKMLIALSKRYVKTGLSVLKDDPNDVGLTKDLEGIKRYERSASGFVPNFAGYTDSVMQLEENISGNNAILDTTTGPYPFIRNSAQPNFAAAVADHGGEKKALQDSMSNQMTAGLLRKARGFIPGFAGGVPPVVNAPTASPTPNLQQLQDQYAINLQRINEIFQELRKNLSLSNKDIRTLSSEARQLAQEMDVQENDLRANNLGSQIPQNRPDAAAIGQAGSRTRFQRFAGGVGNLGSNLAFAIAAPLVAGQLQQVIERGQDRSQQSYGQRFASQAVGSGLSNISTGVALGTALVPILGPFGPLIGAASAAAISLASAALGASDSLEDLQKKSDEYTKQTQDTVGAGKGIIDTFKSLENLDPNSLEFFDANQKLQDYFSKIAETGLDKKFQSAGSDIDLMTKAIKEYEMERATEAKRLREDVTRRGRKDLSVEDLGKKGILRTEDITRRQVQRELVLTEEAKRLYGANATEGQVPASLQKFQTVTRNVVVGKQIAEAGAAGEENRQKILQQNAQLFDDLQKVQTGLGENFGLFVQEFRSQFSDLVFNQDEISAIFKKYSVEGIDPNKFALQLQEIARENGEYGKFIIRNFDKILEGIKSGKYKTLQQAVEENTKKIQEAQDNIRNILFRNTQGIASGLNNIAIELEKYEFEKSIGKLNLEKSASIINSAMSAIGKNITDGFKNQFELLTAETQFRQGKLQLGFEASQFEKGLDLQLQQQRLQQQEKLIPVLRETLNENQQQNIQTFIDEFKRTGTIRGALALGTGELKGGVGAQQKLQDFARSVEEENKLFQTRQDNTRKTFQSDQAFANLTLELNKKIAQEEYKLNEARYQYALKEKALIDSIQLSAQKAQIDTQAAIELLKLPAQSPNFMLGRGEFARQDVNRAIEQQVFKEQIAGQAKQAIADAQIADIQRQVLENNTLATENNTSAIEALIDSLTIEAAKGFEIQKTEIDKIDSKIKENELLLKSNTEMGPEVSERYSNELEKLKRERAAITGSESYARNEAAFSIRQQQTERKAAQEIFAQQRGLGLKEILGGQNLNEIQDPVQFLKEKTDAEKERLSVLQEQKSILEAQNASGQFGSDVTLQNQQKIKDLDKQIETQRANVNKLDAINYDIQTKITVEKARQKQLDEDRAKRGKFTTGVQQAFDEIQSQSEMFEQTFGRNATLAFRDGLTGAIDAAMNRTDDLGNALMDVASGFLKTIQSAFNQQIANNLMLGIGSAMPGFSGVKLGGIQTGGFIRAQEGIYVPSSAGGNGMAIQDFGRTGDVNPALLEDGEYVLNRNAVAAMGGPNILDEINFGRFPRFANGGQNSGSLSAGMNMGEPFAQLSEFGKEQSPEYRAYVDRLREQYQKDQEKKAKRKAFINQLIMTGVSAGVMAGLQGLASSGLFSKASGTQTKVLGKTMDAGRLDQIISFKDTAQTGGLMRFASGGYLPYGNRLNDTIPALLSGGEYIVNSRAVRRYGVGGMNRINAGIARFEDGGLVGTTTGTQTPGNVESSSSNNVSINITVNATAGETASEEQTSTNNQDDQNANLGRRIKQAVLQVIVEEQRSGGLLDSTKKR